MTPNTPALPSASTEPHSAAWLAERFEAFKSCSHRDADGTPLHLLAASMLREMATEIQALRADAQRYRLVRRGQHWSVIDGIGDTLRAEVLDAAIDAAAIRAQAGGDHE